MAKPVDQNQESLFVVGAHTGQIYERPLELEPGQSEADPAVPIMERNLHLQNVLGLLGQVSLREGFVTAVETPHRDRIAERYGDQTTRVARGAERTIKTLETQAKWEFARAFGLFVIADSGSEMWSRPKLTAEVRKAYAVFRGEFAHVRGAARRNELRGQLEKNARQADFEVTKANRAVEARPHAPDKERPKELPKLSTQERLVAIWEDPRAGFLPTTNAEKNQVMAFLDYLDNTAYPLGVNNQLFEVLNHQERERKGKPGIPSGVRSLESIVYQLEDYLSHSLADLTALRDLEVLIGECPNPFVTLAEEISETHPGYARLLRFMDLSELRDKGEVQGLSRSPVRTQVKRWASGNDPGKHKVFADPYIADEIHKVFEKRIAEKAQTLTVGQARKLISDAIIDQEKRQMFMERRMREIATTSYGPRTAPKWSRVSRQILANLNLPLAA